MRTAQLLSLLSASLFLACQHNEAEVGALRKEVFAVHDEIMPKMGDIMDLREQITVDITTTDSLLKLKPSADLQKRKATGLQIGEALDDADHAMMDWMHEFDGDSLEKMDAQKALAYLKSEKQKITAVRDKMLESINQAQQFTGTKP